jgi:hypothetical protein
MPSNACGNEPSKHPFALQQTQQDALSPHAAALAFLDDDLEKALLVADTTNSLVRPVSNNRPTYLQYPMTATGGRSRPNTAN